MERQAHGVMGIRDGDEDRGGQGEGLTGGVGKMGSYKVGCGGKQV